MMDRLLLYKILKNRTGAEISASGNPAIMSDTLKNNPMNEMKVFGWSKQETTTGAQLWDEDNAMSGYILADGTVQNANKTNNEVIGDYQKVSGNNITLSYSVTVPETITSQSLWFAISCYDSEKNFLKRKDFQRNSATGLQKGNTTIELVENTEYIRISWRKYADGVLMASEGTEALPYEPYTGGQPSPSPDYPQEIVSAGMKWSTGKNLFSGFVFGGTSPRAENGIITTKEGTSYIRSDYIPCEVGKHYVYNIPEGWRGSQTVFCNSDKKYIGIPKVPQSFNVPEDTAYFAFQIAKTDTTPIYQADLEAVSKLVQVEQADACTEYEPYTGGVPKLYSDKIGVTAHGKNLFDLEYALKKENWNMIPGRYYYIPYYVGKGATVTVSYDGKPALGLGTYVLVGEKAGETENSYGWLYHSSVQSLVNNTKTFVAEADYIYINGAADYINMFRKHFKNFQIEVSPSPTAYEPYHEPQSLSIQTPTGLPAIPVTSGGNYTDADGQQWIADYVDLKRGKYVQNINTCMIDASTNVFKIGKGGFYWNLPENSLPGILKGIGVGSKYPIFPSKYFARKVFNANAVYSMLYTDDDNMKGLFNSVEELNTFCKERYDAGDPVEFYYVIEPIERDLTPEEIQAYKNLVTYAGTTIVENDAECYMEVSAGGGDSLRAKKLALILGE